MNGFERFTRLLRADAHGVMDQLEERSLLLKQHLREAEVEVAHKRTRLEALDEERRQLAEQAQRWTARVTSLDEDVELALGGDDPELARFAVRQLLPRREALRELEARRAQLDEQYARLADCLEQQETQLASLGQRVRSELARSHREGPLAAAGIACDRSDVAATDEEVELELLRRRRPAQGGA